jgi:hypothetical protein
VLVARAARLDDAPLRTSATITATILSGAA